jgi:hypothetical protein
MDSQDDDAAVEFGLDMLYQFESKIRAGRANCINK